MCTDNKQARMAVHCRLDVIIKELLEIIYLDKLSKFLSSLQVIAYTNISHISEQSVYPAQPSPHQPQSCCTPTGLS